MKKIAPGILFFLFYAPLIFGQNSNLHEFYIGGQGPSNTPETNRSMVSCAPLYSFDTPDLNETGLDDDNSFLWVGGGNGTGFYKCDGVTGAVMQVLPMPSNSSGYYSGDLAVGGNYLWYIYEQSGILLKLDPATGALINQFTLPNNSPNVMDPNCWGIAYDDGFLWETEYNVIGPAPMNTLLYKLTYSAVPIDSFLIPHWILPVKIINGELWGVAFDVPYIYRFDKASGAITDSVPRCVNSCYGLAQNNAGFWQLGISTFNFNSVHLFSSITGVNAEIQPDETEWIIFPQPVNDKLHIRCTTPSNEPVTVQIYSMVGELVKEVNGLCLQHEFTVETGDISPGIYQLIMGSGNLMYSRKIIRM